MLSLFCTDVASLDFELHLQWPFASHWPFICGGRRVFRGSGAFFVHTVNETPQNLLLKVQCVFGDCFKDDRDIKWSLLRLQDSAPTLPHLPRKKLPVNFGPYAHTNLDTSTTVFFVGLLKNVSIHQTLSDVSSLYWACQLTTVACRQTWAPCTPSSFWAGLFEDASVHPQYSMLWLTTPGFLRKWWFKTAANGEQNLSWSTRNTLETYVVLRLHT